MLSTISPEVHRNVHDVLDVPVELLDSTCYFITATAFDTLLQCTTNQSHTRSDSPPRNDKGSLWTSTTHFFSGSLVCTDPPLILATGSAVDVLEREWQNYFVLLDQNNVAPYGRLPSLFSTFSCVHAVSKDYPLDTFGRIPWIILGLSPLRNHIPSATTGEGKMLRTTRGRWRSNSLPSPQTPDESCPAELNPSLSVCFDLNQASYTPSTLLPGSYGSQSSSGSSSGSSSSGSPPNSNNLNILHRHKSANANGNGQNNGSTFFRQAPQRSLHSLMRARLQCLYATSRRPCKVTVCLYFGSNPCPNPSSTSQGNHRTTNSWNLKEALLVAVNDGQPSDEDSWLIGGSGFSYIVADNEYRITLTNGLAADGVYHTPVATFNKLRLIRQWSKWSESVDGEAVWPQAYVEVEDLCDPRIGFVLGPVMFERDGMQGKEWVGEIPSCIQC